MGHVSALLEADTRVSARREALAWVFGLWRSTPGGLSLASARLLVPTTSGDWIPASSALFGCGWPAGTLGDLLGDFLARATPYSSELEGLASCLLAPPRTKPFGSRDVADWAQFLAALGVQAGLQPVARDPEFVPRAWK